MEQLDGISLKKGEFEGDNFENGVFNIETTTEHISAENSAENYSENYADFEGSISKNSVIDTAVSEPIPIRYITVNLTVPQQEIDSAPRDFRRNLRKNSKPVVSLHYLLGRRQGYKSLTNYASGILCTGHTLRQTLENIASSLGFRLMKSREELLFVVRNDVTDLNFTWNRKGKVVESFLFDLDSPVDNGRITIVNLTILS